MRPDRCSLRIATANVAGARPGHGGPPRTDEMATAVAALGADVIALQELDRFLPRSGRVDQASAVADACGAEAAWTACFAAALDGTPGEDATPAAATRPGVPAYGVAVVTRLRVRARHELRMDASRARLPMAVPGPDGPRVRWFPDEQRVALAVELDAPLGALTVVTTHLSFFPPRAVAQLRRLRDWTAELPRPLVLAGDLNLPSPVPAATTGWTPLVAGPTFPASRPRLQLDHLLAASPVPACSLGAVVGVGDSDHRGLVVSIDLPAAA